MSRLARRLALTFLLLCVLPAVALAQSAAPPAGQLTADDLRQVFERLVTASDKGDRKAFARFSRLYPSLYQQAYFEAGAGGSGPVTAMIPTLDRWLLDKATAGSPTAQYWMGERTKVLQQFGAPPPAMADVEKWYRSAADQGFAPAQNALGQVLGFFPEFAKQPFEAEKWLFAAVRNGEDAAGDNLVQAIDIDNQRAGYKPDPDMRAWLQHRADSGDPAAQKLLARVGPP